jgi:regulatory protein
MLQRIVRIENAGPALKARRLFFELDPMPRITAASVVKRLGIDVGLEVDRSTLETTLAAEELPLAKERALQLLGYRERSAQELLGKLRDSGFPDDVSQAVVQRFVEVELVDDERFAAAWVRSRRAAGYGDRRVRRELEDKGVDPMLIIASLDPDQGDDELTRASASLRGRRPRDAADAQRLIRRLLGRGFSIGAAKEAVGLAGVEGEPDSDELIDGDTRDDLR